ncbi:DUF1659 domain-containing protein [Inconstantimicrobium mannanitabidum]|uniref:Uncharacterized protein n=1 Tax=Inconstantimicrobium mannanitabidum TaxID=1604901 RepID=A0ACB5RIR6_9CLOT|nr:DUF1659 domain-containing protein [Clostridium sp. TW13]GKX68974.1 hypothetical protein rsdtw13_42320 [Clostridium sp. TW13]
MAITATKQERSLNIKLETGTKNGNPVYTTQKFGNVADTATDEDLFAVATAIGGVMAAGNKVVLKNELYKLAQA